MSPTPTKREQRALTLIKAIEQERDAQWRKAIRMFFEGGKVGRKNQLAMLREIELNLATITREA